MTAKKAARRRTFWAVLPRDGSSWVDVFPTRPFASDVWRWAIRDKDGNEEIGGTVCLSQFKRITGITLRPGIPTRIAITAEVV